MGEIKLAKTELETGAKWGGAKFKSQLGEGFSIWAFGPMCYQGRAGAQARWATVRA